MNSKRRPQWDDSLADRSQFRLTYSEQLQRKAAYVSKNKESAREELQKRQELLKQGKIPEEMKKTLRNPSVKNTVHSKSQKNSISIQKEVPTVPQATQETHFAPLKKTQKASIEDHLNTLSKLDQAMKDLEAAMLKAANSESKESIDVSKNNEDSISEASLFGISDDDEFYLSKQSFKSKADKKPVVNDAFMMDYNEHKQKNEGIGNIFGVEKKDNINFFKIEGALLGDLEQTSKFCYNDEPIPYENVWADESQNDLFNLVEQTRKDLSAMNIKTNEDFEIAPSEFPQFKYDSDVVPQKFNLVPLGRPTIPRAGTSSLSIFDHVKNVQIDCRKFIIH